MDKYYYCSFPNCEYKSLYNRHVKNHYKIHNRVYLYQCDYKKCKLSFQSFERLRKHRKNIHHERVIDYIISDS